MDDFLHWLPALIALLGGAASYGAIRTSLAHYGKLLEGLQKELREASKDHAGTAEKVAAHEQILSAHRRELDEVKESLRAGRGR
jgi:hypothetical protein